MFVFEVGEVSCGDVGWGAGLAGEVSGGRDVCEVGELMGGWGLGLRCWLGW